MLKVQDLSVKTKKKTILEKVTFELEPQSITVVLGKNGSGKSTLVSCINHMREYEGAIFFENGNLKNNSIRERAKKMAVLAQDLAHPHIKVEELVEMGRTPYLDLSQRLSKEDRKEVNNALESMGILSLRDRYLDEISGGERQKAYLAMIVAQNTPLLVLDEPTTYLDIEHQAEFMDCLKRLKNEYKKTIFVVMHDINLAVEYADYFLVLDEGKLIFTGNKEECMKQEVIERTFRVRKWQTEGKTVFLA